MELKMAYIHGQEADYLAPEIILDEQPTSIASDVFSVGRLLIDIAQVVDGRSCTYLYSRQTLCFKIIYIEKHETITTYMLVLNCILR